MIAYFDSSSIVKWFFDEIHSDLARGTRDEASLVVTSIISFPEVMSAIFRAMKEGRCSRADMELVRDEFLRIWPDFHWVWVGETLIQQAGQLIFRYGLRAYDSIHLACAMVLKREGEELALFFSCFDRSLNRAASREGFRIYKEFA